MVPQLSYIAEVNLAAFVINVYETLWSHVAQNANSFALSSDVILCARDVMAVAKECVVDVNSIYHVVCILAICHKSHVINDNDCI